MFQNAFFRAEKSDKSGGYEAKNRKIPKNMKKIIKFQKNILTTLDKRAIIVNCIIIANYVLSTG